MSAASDANAITTDATSDADGAGANATYATDPSIRYDTHVQKLGWQKNQNDQSTWFADGQEAGTNGKSLRLEALRIALDGAHAGDSVSYQAHVQGIGWQDEASDGDLAGTIGKSKRLEAIRISLEGDVADAYDVYYCTHVQKYGWLGWAKNGEDSGTAGLGLRLEALRVVLVPKGGAAPASTSAYGPNVEALLTATAHVQRVGWQQNVTEMGSNAIQIGTTGRGLRMEAVRLTLLGGAGGGSVAYNAHVQSYGWQSDINAETTWAADGQTAGTAGASKRLEAVRIVMLPKGSAAPATLGSQRQPYVADAATFRGVGATVTSSEGTTSAVQAKNVLYDGSERTYLFLPSYADLSNVKLSLDATRGASSLLVGSSSEGSFTTVRNGSTVNVTGMGCAADSDGAYRLWTKLSESGRAVPLYVMKSASVGAMHITSDDPAREGRDWVEGSEDHTSKTTGSLVMVNANGSEVYDGGLTQIKGRGNTTWNQDKRPYQIKLDKKCDLLETGDKDNKSKTWVLLANSMDPTLLNNQVTYDLAAALGLDAPDCAPVDLYYDGEYLGSYLLSEKVQVGSGRVDIEDLEGQVEDANPGVDLDSLPTAQAKNAYGYAYQYAKGVRDPADITGGYLLELDESYWSDEVCWFNTSVGHVVVKSPEVCSASCVAYISEQFQGALNALTGSGSNAGGATFDLDSFVKTFLLNEVVNNWDYMHGSMYFYKDADSSTIYSGPVWDFDHAVGAPLKQGRTSTESYENFRSSVRATWVLNNSTVQARARELWPAVKSLVRNTLLSSSASATSGRLRSLAYYYNRVAASARMNRIATPFPTEAVGAKLPSTYRETYGMMRTWTTNRLAWLDGNVSRLKGTVSTRTTTYKGTNYVRVYDYDYYLAKNPSVKKAVGTDPAKVLAYFVEHGMAAGQVASREFDPHYYANTYADLKRAYGSNWKKYYQHFMNTGIAEARHGVALTY